MTKWEELTKVKCLQQPMGNLIQFIRSWEKS